MKTDVEFDTLLKKIERKANECNTLVEIDKLYKSTPAISQITDIYERRRKELFAIEKANQCKSSKEIKKLLGEADKESFVVDIYKKRLEELYVGEAEKDLDQCNTAEEVKKLIEESLSSGSYSSKLNILGKSWMKLHLQE